MKITKAYLKKVIKEELAKEARNFGRPPIELGRGSISSDEFGPTDEQRQEKLESAMTAAASLSDEMTAILSNVDINDRASLKAAYEKAKRVADAVPRTLFDLDYDIDPGHYFIDDEDYEYDKKNEPNRRYLKAKRARAMSPKEPYNADELRGNK
jgi:hypothetical protein